MTAARHCIQASLRAIAGGGAATLVVVLGTEGSTYVKPGALALFEADGGQHGWLSGGCLEPEIAQRALQALREGRVDVMDIDTRSDEDLLSGSAVGCRGRLHLGLLPLPLLPGWEALARDWLARRGTLRLQLSPEQGLQAALGTRTAHWSPPIAAEAQWPAGPLRAQIDVPPAVALLGAGPESAWLLPWLRELGWITTLVEKRPRWRGQGGLADHHLEATPAQAIEQGLAADAALVMHHHFELDREALDGLAGNEIPFVGLLGPRRRQQDLFQLLRPAQRDALRPRLRSPIGLPLGGEGPQAIALSIAAQLQRWREAPSEA